MVRGVRYVLGGVSGIGERVLRTRNDVDGKDGDGELGGTWSRGGGGLGFHLGKKITDAAFFTTDHTLLVFINKPCSGI